jgi:hypothetical protein
MPALLEPSDNPFAPEIDTRHAGKVFVLTQRNLHAAGAVGSDGTNPSKLVNRFLLCLWDADNDTSFWITLQSIGDYEVPHATKRLYAGADANWMDPKKTTYHRNGTVWRLGALGKPLKFTQKQQRAVVKDELLRIQKRISSASVAKLL